MAEDLLGERLSEGHQEDGPVNGVEADDVLADEVEVRRPELLVLVRGIAVRVIADSRDIVRQGVQPDIDGLVGVEGDRNAPLDGGSGNAEVLQAGQEEIVHHLILPAHGLDEIGVGIDVVNEPGGVLAHAEEVSLLLLGVNLTAADRALAIHELGLRVEGLALVAVEAVVVALVDVPLLVELLENLLDL